MKFAVGYQLPEENEEPFLETVKEFKAYIGEVYFPWLDAPSGRSPMTVRDGFVDWEGQKQLEKDLKAIRKMGISLDLLLNANCYGAHSLSRHFQNYICSVVSYLKDNIGLDTVTTASLLIAKTVKENFPEIEVRASVNMRIGTIKGMEYVADLFDGFHLQREYNRELERIKELKNWTDRHNKGLYLLANSGCLNFCSGQTFHDNLVAHEKEISETKVIRDWNPSVCWNYYKNRDNWVSFLQNSWIRPEDIHNYRDYFPIVKLATRMHSNPRKVIKAYAEGRFDGNLLDLLEPGYGPLFAPYIIDNTAFPEDWFIRTTGCNLKCSDCDYCSSVLRKVLKRWDEIPGGSLQDFGKNTHKITHKS